MMCSEKTDPTAETMRSETTNQADDESIDFQAMYVNTFPRPIPRSFLDLVDELGAAVTESERLQRTQLPWGDFETLDSIVAERSA